MRRLLICLVFLLSCLFEASAAEPFKGRAELAAESERLEKQATDLWGGGDWDRIEKLLSQALKAREAAFGPFGNGVPRLIDLIARVHHNRKDFAEAADWYREAAEVAERSLGAAHPDVTIYLDGLGSALRQDGRPAAAVPVLQRSLHLRTVRGPPGNSAIAASLETLGRAYLDLRLFPAAEVVLQEAANIHQKAAGTGGPLYKRVKILLDEARAELAALRLEERRVFQLRSALAAAGIVAAVILLLALWWEAPRAAAWSTLKRGGILSLVIALHLAFSIGVFFIGSAGLGRILIENAVPDAPEELERMVRAVGGCLTWWLGYAVLFGTLSGLRAICRRPLGFSFLADPAT